VDIWSSKESKYMTHCTPVCVMRQTDTRQWELMIV